MGLLAFYRRISLLWTPFTCKRPSLYAAAAGFYLTVSAIPAAVFLLGVLSRFPAVLQAGADFLLSVIPSAFAPLVTAAVKEAAGAGGAAVLSLSALASLWSASRGVLALTDGFRAVLELPLDERGFFRRRLTAAGLFLLLAAAGLLPFPGGSLAPLWAGFCLLYSVLPQARLPFRCCVAGSGAAALGWMLFSAAFSAYVERSSGLRGGLGFAVLALIWLHCCMQLLLYGAILAKLLAEGRWRPLKILRNALFPPCS